MKYEVSGPRNAQGSRGTPTMRILFVLSDAPCGSERTYNALRLAVALTYNDAPTEVSVF